MKNMKTTTNQIENVWSSQLFKFTWLFFFFGGGGVGGINKIWVKQPLQVIILLLIKVANPVDLQKSFNWHQERIVRLHTHLPATNRHKTLEGSNGETKKTNCTLENFNMKPPKMEVDGRWCSFSFRWFLGSMLICSGAKWRGPLLLMLLMSWRGSATCQTCRIPRAKA